MDDRIKDIKERYSESYGTLSPFFQKMLELNNMYSNQQWTDADARNSRKKNIYPSVYNFMKKNVDVVIGIQRQSRAALKVLPEEPGDNIKAGIASILLHHSVRKTNGYMHISTSMKDQLMGGLGWIDLSIDFSKDPVNGNLKIKSGSPFNRFFDPGTKEMDLSDCSYIVNREAVHKNVIISAYPDHEEEIKASNSDYKSDYYVMEESGLKNKCVVKELWERVPETWYTIFADGRTIDMSQNDYNARQEDIFIAKQDPQYTEVKHSRQRMKLAISANDILLYDGYSFYEDDFYPFIPIFGFYNMSSDTWSTKLQGILEVIKDSQMEYNKTRTSITHYMLSSIHSGWLMDKNAVDDIRVLTKGMSSPVIQKNPGKDLQRIQPPAIPDVLLSYANDSIGNIMKIGLNAEALGNDSGVESIKGMKMKMMQGLATIGEITDNFNFAFTQTGKIALKIIYQFYGLEKIKGILGSEYEWLAPEHLLELKSMERDIEVDDTTYSPVQKMYRLETKLQAQQYGVPGFEAEDFLEDLDIDPADRFKLAQRAEMRKQQEQQAQQANDQANQQLLQSKAAAEQAKIENMNVQSQLMGTSVIKNIRELGGNPGDISAVAEERIAQQNPQPPMPQEEGIPLMTELNQ